MHTKNKPTNERDISSQLDLPIKMFATRFAARAIPAFKQQAVVRRQMSGHSAEHAKKETEIWYKATIGTLIVGGNLVVLNLVLKRFMDEIAVEAT